MHSVSTCCLFDFFVLCPSRCFRHPKVTAVPQSLCAPFVVRARMRNLNMPPAYEYTALSSVAGVRALSGNRHGRIDRGRALGVLQVLSTCRHENIVPLLGVCMEPPCLVYRLMPNNRYIQSAGVSCDFLRCGVALSEVDVEWRGDRFTRDRCSCQPQR